MRPAAFAAWATRMFKPAERRTPDALQVVPVTVAGVPLTSTEATPALTVPLTVMLSVAKGAISAGASMVTDGAFVTRVSVMAGALILLPAASAQAMETLFGPSSGSSTVARNIPLATEAAM